MKHIAIIALLVVTVGRCFAWELDVHARFLAHDSPIYPADEKKEGRKVVVSVLVQIDDKGTPTVVRVMNSWSSAFDKASRSAVADWKFKPAMRNGRLTSDLLEFVLLFDPMKEVEILGPLYEP